MPDGGAFDFLTARRHTFGELPEAYRRVGTGGVGGTDGWYIAPTGNGTATGTGALGLNQLRAVPFLAMRGGVLQHMAFSVTAGAVGAVARVGLYESDPETLYPTRRLADALEQDCAGAGFKGPAQNGHNLNVSLTPGELYWAAFLAGVAIPTTRQPSQTSVPALLGFTGNAAMSPMIGWQVAQAYGALPLNFPVGGAQADALNLVAILLRFSSVTD